MTGMHGAIEQRGDIDARDRRGHHTEVRQRRIAAADIRLIDENAPEVVRFRVLAELRIGIGDSDEVLAGLSTL